MTRNADRLLNLDRPLSRNGIHAPAGPSRAPFVDGAAADAELFAQLWPRAGGLDGERDRVFGVHACQFGTESSVCQATESSMALRHAQSMNIKEKFAERLVHALDNKGVAENDAGRKRYLAKLLGISERQVGNYLRAEKLPSQENMLHIAEDLGVNINWLMLGAGPVERLDEFEVSYLMRLRRLDPENRVRLYRIAEALEAPYDAQPMLPNYSRQSTQAATPHHRRRDDPPPPTLEITADR